MGNFTKRDFILLFNEGVDQLIIPALNDLRREVINEFKKLRGEINDRFDRVEGSLGILESKVDDLSKKQDGTENILRNHEIRFKKLETVQVTS